MSVFDPKINTQHSQECLKRLLSFYTSSSEDFSGETTRTHSRREHQRGTIQNLTEEHKRDTTHNPRRECSRETTHENRAEFEATYLLFNLGAEEALEHYLSLDKHWRYGID